MAEPLLAQAAPEPDATIPALVASDQVHARRGMGAEDYCTCDQPWPHRSIPSCPICTRIGGYRPGDVCCDTCLREAHTLAEQPVKRRRWLR